MLGRLLLRRAEGLLERLPCDGLLFPNARSASVTAEWRLQTRAAWSFLHHVSTQCQRNKQARNGYSLSHFLRSRNSSPESLQSVAITLSVSVRNWAFTPRIHGQRKRVSAFPLRFAHERCFERNSHSGRRTISGNCFVSVIHFVEGLIMKKALSLAAIIAATATLVACGGNAPAPAASAAASAAEMAASAAQMSASAAVTASQEAASAASEAAATATEAASDAAAAATHAANEAVDAAKAAASAAK